MTFLTILAIILGLVFLLVVIGMRLPKAYHNEESISFERSIEDVWTAVYDFGTVPMITSPNHTVESMPDENGLPVWLVDMGSSQLTVQTIEATSPIRVVRAMTDSVVPMTATFTHELSSTNGSTILHVREDSYIDDGTWHVPIFRIMVRLTRGMAIKGYFKKLSEHFA
ncbi:MAG: hypothetical protein GY943_29635 [Chloroflexi bacterium]|nr:hypothetical protein [Chloroflexota bacterium]